MELAWKYRKEYNVDLARMQKEKERNIEKEEYTDNDQENDPQIPNLNQNSNSNRKGKQNSSQPFIIEPQEQLTSHGSNKLIQPGL